MMNKNLILILVGLLSISWSLTVSANPCEKSAYDDFSYLFMLETMGNGVCFEAENNNSELAQSVKALLADNDLQPRNAAVLALQAIEKRINSLAQESEEAAANNAQLLVSALIALQSSMAEREKIPEPHLKRNWGLNQVRDLPEALDGIDLVSALEDEACEPVRSGLCERQYAQAESMVRAIRLANAAIDHYTKAYRMELAEDRTLRHKMWDSYFDDLTFQYPWEMGLNSLWLGWFDDRAVVDGNRVGFRGLPDDKLVFLHPDVNPLYHEDSNQEYDLTLTVESIGYERFKFDKRTGRVKSSWGISHMAAYLPQQDSAESDWNTGWMFKYNNYSLGLIDDDEERAVIFNIDLAQKLFDVKQEKRKYYDDIKFKLETLREDFAQ